MAFIIRFVRVCIRFYSAVYFLSFEVFIPLKHFNHILEPGAVVNQIIDIVIVITDLPYTDRH